MKNAASCDTWCELQDTLSTDSLNAHCALGLCSRVRLSEGRIIYHERCIRLCIPGRTLRGRAGNEKGTLVLTESESAPSCNFRGVCTVQCSQRTTFDYSSFPMGNTRARKCRGTWFEEVGVQAMLAARELDGRVHVPVNFVATERDRVFQGTACCKTCSAMGNTRARTCPWLRFARSALKHNVSCGAGSLCSCAPAKCEFRAVREDSSNRTARYNSCFPMGNTRPRTCRGSRFAGSATGSDATPSLE